MIARVTEILIMLSMVAFFISMMVVTAWVVLGFYRDYKYYRRYKNETD